MEISEPQKKDGVLGVELISVLLELSAIDDITGFKHAVEEEGRDVDEASLWYGRIIGCKKMGLVERTPLMVAAMFGSMDVLNYILQTCRVDVNRACGSDGATALRCAAASGSTCSHEVIRLLVDSSADISSADAHGNQPVDLIAPCIDSSSKSIKKSLEATLKGAGGIEVAFFKSNQESLAPRVLNDVNSTEKKEYPVDPSIPDIKTGIYGTDEFRMYTFKVKPCSRAYSHDWTECPFVHPGENARRRDPRKYHYSCVPCPEFRKGSCNKGDACEYAHGVFESWLHPAQYRTRLCKDETNCTRRVCFFAHKLEELRPLYASTGSAVPSPRSFSSSATAFDIASISPLMLGSPSLLMPSTSTPPSPMTPTAASSSMAGDMWPNPINIVPPTLQLPGSRLRTSLSARDVDIEAELLGLENQRRRQQLLEELAGLSSPLGWNSSFASAGFAFSGDRAGELSRLTRMNLNKDDDVFSSLDPSLLSRLQGVLLGSSSAQLHSTTGMQIRQNTKQQLLSSYSNGLSCSPIRASSVSSSSVRASVFGVDAPGSPAVSNSRLSAFTKRSHSFIDRSAVNHLSGLSSPAASGEMIPSHISDWGSPDGKLEWGVQGEELNKLRKSASFGIRSNGSSAGAIKDAQTMKPTQLGFNEQQQKQQHLDPSGSEAIPSWLEQLYMEQEQIVA